jgi:hypothetical protein
MVWVHRIDIAAAVLGRVEHLPHPMGGEKAEDP